MTLELEVDGRIFKFDSGWRASKYDDWSFYRERLQSRPLKAVDLVAFVDAEPLHLVEVKDYDHADRRDSIPLAELPATVRAKCLDTLTGLSEAKTEALGTEKEFAAAATLRLNTSITLHVELPQHTRGRLGNKNQVLANLRLKLRATVKDLDPRAVVEDHSTAARWTTMRVR